MNRALVVVAGPTTDQPVGIDRRTSDVVIAADGGAALADVLGWPIDALVGDFDSIEPDTLARTRAAGATVRAFPSDKDETDLELALAEARERAADEVIVVGGGGGRLDHLLGVIAALSGPIVRDPGWRPRVEARLDGQRVVAVDDSWSERLDEFSEDSRPRPLRGPPTTVVDAWFSPVPTKTAVIEVGKEVHGCRFAVRVMQRAGGPRAAIRTADGGPRADIRCGGEGD